MPTEISWTDVLGLPDYQVSSGGHIRRSTSGKSTRVGRILKAQIAKDGYLYLMVRRHKIWIHRAVLEAFVGPCPEGQETRHLNGDPTDNCVANLAWGNRFEQREDARRHGTLPIGERSWSAKLTEKQVREIRRLYGSLSLRTLGQQFGVSHTAIRRAALGLKWRHLNG
ncbi:hypothetical protein LCGC14_0312690 [marine sediment metagenome]|uniref:HNH nuclease domain-containing protein n=1 Tax=marine sediment metagenome TaxID=412755 RepID=A0A0F9U3W5_9ZZZZ